MTRAERGETPAQPTEEELNKVRLLRLSGAANKVQEHFNDPQRLGAYFKITGFRLDPDNWREVQLVRDTIVKLWFPGRSGGVA